MKTNGNTIYAEIAKCLACRSCEIACALEHSSTKDLFAAIHESPSPTARVSVESVEGMAIPLQCRHCEDAPCITVCPTKALHRFEANQPVLIKEERCIGCKMCIMACPFGVITMREGGKAALKCDLCLNRVDRGELPACVSACPTLALQFLDVDEITRRKRQKTAESAREAEQAVQSKK